MYLLMYRVSTAPHLAFISPPALQYCIPRTLISLSQLLHTPAASTLAEVDSEVDSVIMLCLAYNCRYLRRLVILIIREIFSLITQTKRRQQPRLWVQPSLFLLCPTISTTPAAYKSCTEILPRMYYSGALPYAVTTFFSSFLPCSQHSH
jgi:hypothetical protein